MKQSGHFRVSSLLMTILAVGLAGEAQTTRPAHLAHNPKRWEKDIAAFEAADVKNPPQPDEVEFFGSSTIRIWKLATSFPGQAVFNRGFGGSWSADCAYYAKRMVVAYKPRTVIFYAGDNDIAADQPASEVVRSFKEFVKTVHAALPKTRIVFISIKPSPSRSKYWDVMQQANAAVRDFAKHTKNVSFVDMTPEMLGADGQGRRELFRKDMLHMNAKGYAIWNKRIAPYVDR